MAPPENYTFYPPFPLENWIRFLFNSQTSADNEETLVHQIAHYESSLEEMIEELDHRDQLAREIESDVSAWPAKYHAWLGRRRVVIKIQEVSPI